MAMCITRELVIDPLWWMVPWLLNLLCLALPHINKHVCSVWAVCFLQLSMLSHCSWSIYCKALEVPDHPSRPRHASSHTPASCHLILILPTASQNRRHNIGQYLVLTRLSLKPPLRRSEIGRSWDRAWSQYRGHYPSFFFSPTSSSSPSLYLPPSPHLPSFLLSALFFLLFYSSSFPPSPPPFLLIHFFLLLLLFFFFLLQYCVSNLGHPWSYHLSFKTSLKLFICIFIHYPHHLWWKNVACISSSGPFIFSVIGL